VCSGPGSSDSGKGISLARSFFLPFPRDYSLSGIRAGERLSIWAFVYRGEGAVPRRAVLDAVEPERVHLLNSKAWRTGYYYWMQACQKAFWNPALELAVELANDRGLPVLVAFGLRPSYPEANLRHYLWMLEGLEETARALEERSIGFVMRLGHPPDVALELAKDAGGSGHR
jgi:hypothetical protein